MSDEWKPNLWGWYVDYEGNTHIFIEAKPGQVTEFTGCAVKIHVASVELGEHLWRHVMASG